MVSINDAPSQLRGMRKKQTKTIHKGEEKKNESEKDTQRRVTAGVQPRLHTHTHTHTNCIKKKQRLRNRYIDKR